MNPPEVCSHCDVRVVPLPDGTCPVCRAPLEPRTQSAVPRGNVLPAEVQQLANMEANFLIQRNETISALVKGYPVPNQALPTVTREILPQCRLAIQALATSSAAQSLPPHIIDRLSEYHTLREQAWQAFVSAIESNDAAPIRSHEQYLQRSNALLAMLNTDSAPPPPGGRVAEFHAMLHRCTPHVWVCPTLVAMNAIVFVAMVLSGGGFFSPPVQMVLDWGANFGPRTLDGQWWRLLTCMFLHFGLLHVGFNMWVLWQLGHLVERLVGNIGFIILYVASGLFASIASLVWNPIAVSAGASGAVFGVCGALLGFLALRRDTIPATVLKSLQSSLYAFVGYNVLFGLMIPAIDMAAHLGGLVFGFGCGLVLSQPLSADVASRRWPRNLLAIVAGSLVLSLAAWALPEPPPDVETGLERVSQLETESLDAYNRLLEQSTNGTLSNPQFADGVEQKVLPPCQKARAILESFLEHPIPNKATVQRLRKYFELRNESWKLLISALRENDAQSMGLYESKLKQLERFANPSKFKDGE